MKVIKTVKEMQQLISTAKNQRNKIGYVPTMGYLHEGHFSLINKAKEQTDIVIVSIFVNPTQFGPNEDFDSYPRDYDHDQHIVEKLGVDYLFYPEVDEMYDEHSIMSVVVQKRVDKLCGQSRPGHFDGVATILVKLFNTIQPDTVFFGMKDAQQVAVVDGLIKSFHYPIELVGVETVREQNGLAKSSRNVKLTSNEKIEAPSIYQALQNGFRLFNEGEKRSKVIKEAIYRKISNEITLGTIDYIDILSYPQLEYIENLDRTFILAIAVQFSNARLIDNIVVNI